MIMAEQYALDTLDTDIHSYLERHQRKELLRFVTVGSVDDGKSTLIGRLLHDTQGVYEDQLADARRKRSKTEASSGGAPLPAEAEFDFALITDGLRAEREQGITIDVAYRYFTTARRKFIIADTPGHIQYTRNMATGASTADVAIILIDARHGVLQQSRRHAYIASLLGIPNLAVCINKMDLADWDESRFHAIRSNFASFVSRLHFRDVSYLPMSAKKGENVVQKSVHMPWYGGPALLGYLETVDITGGWNHRDLRLPIQYVLRPHQDYRGFAGQLASGILRKGDSVMALPSGKSSRVKAIDIFGGGEAEEAQAPLSVALRLEDEVDISRGDILVRRPDTPGRDPEEEPAKVGRTFDAMLVWMTEQPLDTAKSYWIKHAARYIRADLHTVHHRIDMDTLEELAAPTLQLNDIGRVSLTCHQPLVFDPYRRNRRMGAFVVIDSLTNNTVGAGMILDASEAPGDVVRQIGRQSGVSVAERMERLKQKPVTLWLSGLSFSGKAPLAYALERRLFDLGYTAHVLKGDMEDGRADALSYEELARTAVLFNEAGLICIALSTSPTEQIRNEARERVGRERFIHLHVATPLEVCRSWDTEGRYAAAEAGTLGYGVAGVSYAMEGAREEDVVISLDKDPLEAAVRAVEGVLRERGILL